MFNPEHDLALAVGKGPYTPPAEVVNLRKANSLLPALYADNGDFILITDPLSDEEIRSSEFYPLVKKKNLNLVSPELLPQISHKIDRIEPWGWDYAIRNMLKSSGMPDHLLLSQENIEEIRRLSHRRTAIPFREFISTILGEKTIKPVKELFSLKEVEEFLGINPVVYFKAPWSSSGRGIVVSDHIKTKGLFEWCHGIIRRQGSVMAEPAWDRVFDFATEWIIRDNEPKFLGYSIFQTSSRGKYHKNIIGTENEVQNLIFKSIPSFSQDIIMAQAQSLKSMIAPSYNGYLGIDMLADSEGNINTCVEINLRMTMGHVALIRNKQ